MHWTTMIWCYIKYNYILRHKISGERNRGKCHMVYCLYNRCIPAIPTHRSLSIFERDYTRKFSIRIMKTIVYEHGQCNLQNKKCLSESVPKDTIPIFSFRCELIHKSSRMIRQNISPKFPFSFNVWSDWYEIILMACSSCTGRREATS